MAHALNVVEGKCCLLLFFKERLRALAHALDVVECKSPLSPFFKGEEPLRSAWLAISLAEKLPTALEETLLKAVAVAWRWIEVLR